MITYREDKEVAHFKILDSFHKIFEDKTKWHLHTKKWGRLKSHIVFQNATCVQAEVIELYSNKEPQLLIAFVCPRYPALRELNLKNNNIQSIERLRDLECRELRLLNLADNNLTQVTRALNKAYMPNLEVLILYANNIIEIGGSKHTLAMNFHQNKPDNQQKEGEDREGTEKRQRGLIELILGVNRLTNMKWLNKLSHTERIKKLSLQNNPAKQNCQLLKHWHFDHQKILI